jgi:hypothetical protein
LAAFLGFGRQNYSIK